MRVTQISFTKLLVEYTNSGNNLKTPKIKTGEKKEKRIIIVGHNLWTLKREQENVCI